MVTLSTSRMAGRAYHHGDLRAALIQAGLAELDRTGPGELSLRALARAVGVSPTAVYRHFPDKGALLSALGQSVAERLGECQRQAADGARTLEDAFAAIGREYVRFALANPTHFRLMLACYQPREALSGEPVLNWSAFVHGYETWRVITRPRTYCFRWGGVGGGTVPIFCWPSATL